MICTDCASAADRRLGPDEHCDSTGGEGAQCTCQHQTDRYREEQR